MMSNGMMRSSASALAIDGEGDAGAPEQEFGLGAPQLQKFPRRLVQPLLQAFVTRPTGAVGQRHFVEGTRHRVLFGVSP